MQGEVESKTIYKQPENNSQGNSANSIDELITEGRAFTNAGDDDQTKTSKIQEFSQTIYNILLTIGIVVAVIAGGIIGIKLMVSNVEQKAEAKKYLVPYIAGCIIVFGGFAIWKLVVTILQGL